MAKAKILVVSNAGLVCGETDWKYWSDIHPCLRLRKKFRLLEVYRHNFETIQAPTIV